MKISKLTPNQKLLARACKIYDYWFYTMDKFYLEKRVEYFSTDTGITGMSYKLLYHFDWAEHPVQHKYYFAKLKECSKLTTKFRKRVIKELRSNTGNMNIKYELGAEDLMYNNV